MQTRCHKIKAITWERRRLAVFLNTECRHCLWVKINPDDLSHPFIVSTNSWNIKKDNKNHPHTDPYTHPHQDTCTPGYLCCTIGNKGRVCCWDCIETFNIRRMGAYRPPGRLAFHRDSEAFGRSNNNRLLVCARLISCTDKRTWSSPPFVSFPLFACVSA